MEMRFEQRLRDKEEMDRTIENYKNMMKLRRNNILAKF